MNCFWIFQREIRLTEHDRVIVIAIVASHRYSHQFISYLWIYVLIKCGERRRAAFRRVPSSANSSGDGAMSHNAGVKMLKNNYWLRLIYLCMLLCYAFSCVISWCSWCCLWLHCHFLLDKSVKSIALLIIWKTYRRWSNLKSHAGDAWKVLKTCLEACTSTAAAKGSRLRREGADNGVDRTTCRSY